MYVLFPTLVYETKLNFDNRFLETKARGVVSQGVRVDNNDWRCDTITTLNQYDLINDQSFSNLIQTIASEVEKFSKEFGSHGKAKPIDAWINIASPGAFQEYHIHTGSHFSVAYYVKTNSQSGNIVFRSAEADTDMFPLPLDELTPASYKTMSLPAEEGKLLIFRSNLKHMVEKNESNEDRISISANFVIEK